MLKPRTLGQTDILLSPLTLGTVKFGRNQSVKYPSPFDLPTDQAISNLLTQALENGITSLDTAPAYGLSEQRLGELLKGQRQQWQIISKAGENYDVKNDHSSYNYQASELQKNLEQSLRLLKTDYLDCWMLHSNGEDLSNLSDEVIYTLQKAKQAGWVRSIGASTKTVVGGQYALEHLDCIMMAASLQHTEEEQLFETAETLNKGILLKKIYDSGWALNSDNKLETMQNTLQQLFSFEAVTSAVVGTINPKHLLENIHAYQQSASS